MMLQSKMTVYAAIAAMLALMGGIVYYSSLDNPFLEQVGIELESVQVTNINNIQNTATVQVVFLVTNPTDKTFTVPSISYELYGDGQIIGAGQYSTEDIAMPGRAAFYGGASIPLKSSMTITTDAGTQYQNIVSNNIQEYGAEGIITVESAWAIVEVNFESSIIQ
ncbi:MAG: hypothetical protein F4W68_05125 [Cenarchaeum sp. SB0661_bin_35]|nr:hypothetical protein [Cenarchaeum sp. SB0667_bin_13]MXZ93870.1 hypothetical protein [Cenarchaeum sp. SB0666_bin_15]MYC79860.1 hypothetical protein [Cenarchaeum sp. SB0661_bin_35]MYD58050.1 hypothetical protein [Cenarchaeum sp. SB0678_bin_8]MYG32422.1 hypothetical protein [Cenarchaeum sp. SB0677_bin_16]MYJ27691.1 hypothetical protein [Cenarchaeum sp. SB0672_bin_9]